MSSTADYQCDFCKQYSRFPDPLPPEVLCLMCSWCSGSVLYKVENPPPTLRPLTEKPEQPETVTVDRRALTELLSACEEVLQHDSVPLGAWHRLDDAVTHLAVMESKKP